MIAPTTKQSSCSQLASSVPLLVARRSITSYWPTIGLVALILVLSPFFEPPIIAYFEGVESSYSQLAKYFGLFADGCKVAVSVGVIIFLFARVDIKRDIVLMLALVWCVIPVLMNNTMFLGAREMAKSLSLIALILLLRYMFKSKPNVALDALCILFFIITMCNIASILLAKVGIVLVAHNLPIYFFGGKNSIFLSGIMLIAALSMRSVFRTGVVGFESLAFAVIYVGMSFLVDSASSALCYLLITALLAFLIVFGPKTILFDARFILVVIVSLFVFTILFNAQFQEFVGSSFGALGRSTSFSDRDQLWLQAEALFMEHPFFGNGLNIEYALGYELVHYVNHPHCIYLEYAVTYGIPFIVLFVLDITKTTLQVARLKRTMLVAVAVVMYYGLLFHSLYDLVILFNYIVFREFVMFAIDSNQAPGLKHG